MGMRWIEALGWPGVAGCALLGAAAMFFGVVLYPLEKRLEEVRTAPPTASSPARAIDAPPESSKVLRARLDQFYAYLDSGKTIEDQLAEVHAAAEASGLLLKRAEYRLSEGSTDRIRRYEVTLPVTGTYPQIRHFVNTILGSTPTVALRSVSFQRKRIADPNVETEIVLRLYVGRAV